VAVAVAVAVAMVVVVVLWYQKTSYHCVCVRHKHLQFHALSSPR